MAFTRVTEIHGEISPYEFMYWGAGAADVRPVRSTSRAHTGTYSFRMEARSGPMVIPLSGASVARASLFHRMDSNVNGDVNVIEFKQEKTALAAVEVRLMEDEQQVWLYVDGVVQGIAQMADSYIQASTWVQIALVADALTGNVSVYTAPSADLSLESRIINYSGAITRSAWDICRIGRRVQTNGWFSYCYLDDIYVDIGDGGESDVRPPAYGFMPSYVDFSGSSSGFTPLAGSNYQMVDDGAVDDGDTTYNKVLTSAAGLSDNFERGAVALPANHKITAAIPFVVVRKLDAAQDAQIANITVDGATEEEGDFQSVGLEYGVRRSRFENDPNGAAWSEVSFNQVESGYRAGGSFS